MAKCSKCGRKGLFLKVNRNGICDKCNQVVSKVISPPPRSNEEHHENEILSTGKIIAAGLKKELSLDGRGEQLLSEIQRYGFSTLFSEEINEVMSLLAYRAFTCGERPEAVTKELLKSFPFLEHDAVYSAIRTKYGIASSALVKLRSLSLGLPWYIWRTARDGDRVRESHRIMEGVICNWNDPPNPSRLMNGSLGMTVHPGYDAKCRCIALPVLDMEDVALPVRVHVAERIYEVTTVERLLEITNESLI